MPTQRTGATMRLIELAEHLSPSGEIGDGLVNQFHEAAAMARLEQYRARHPVVVSGARMDASWRERFDTLVFAPVGRPSCFGSRPGGQQRAENGCDDCPVQRECLG